MQNLLAHINNMIVDLNMPKIIAYYNIFIASPSDIVEERRLVKNIIRDWNIAHKDLNIQLDSVSWDTHARPEMGEPPQTTINKQLVNDCDFLICFFGNRLGSHTETQVSGTVEEINKFLDAGKPVLVYFSNLAIPPNELDVSQFQELKNYKETCRQKGLLKDYNSIEDLKDSLNLHITPTVIQLHKKNSEDYESDSYSEDNQQPSLDLIFKRLTFFYQKVHIEFDLADFENRQFSFVSSLSMASSQPPYYNEEKLFHLFEEIQNELWNIAAWLNIDSLESVKLKVHALITRIKGFNRSLRQGNFRSRSLGYYNDTYYDVSKLEQERNEILDQFQLIISELHEKISE
jgi:hypothetical protein